MTDTTADVDGATIRSDDRPNTAAGRRRLPGREPPTRAETIGLTLASASVFAFAAWMMRRREVWLDEAFSYTAANLPFGQLVSFAIDPRGELNMALYYVVLGPFAAISASGWWLRLPSLIATVATVGFVWLIADRVSGQRFVRVAAVLLLISHPLTIDYAFEARAYGMLFAATTGLTLLLLVALDGSRRARWAYTVLLPLLITLHFLVIFVIAAHAVAIVVTTPGSWRRRLGRTAALTGPGLVVAAIASVAVFHNQGTLANNESLSPWSFGSAVYAVTGRAGPLTFLVIAALVAAGLAITRSRSTRPAGMILLITAAVPAALSLLASIQRPIFTPRYLVNLVPILACVAAIGIAAAIADRRWRHVALATMVTLGLVGQGFILWAPSHETPDTASAFVVDHARPGDVVVFDNPFAQMPYQRYLDATGEAGPVQADLLTDPAFPTRYTRGPELGPLVEDLPPGGSVWIIENRSGPARTAVLRAELAGTGGLHVAERTDFDAVSVERWTRSP